MPTAITNWSEAIMTSLAGAMAMFFAVIPKILGVVAVLIVGWFIAWLVGKGVHSVLHAVKFNDLADRAGLSDFVAKTGEKADASEMIATIAKWFVRLIALIVAFDALGLPAVSGVMNSLLLWLPNLVVAVIALVIGGLAATALSNLVRGTASEAGLDRPDVLAKVAKTAVWAFAILVAVSQIGIATDLVNTLFMASIGALALARALAFGLGSRDTAAMIVHHWYAGGQTTARAASADPTGVSFYDGPERRSGTTDRRHGSAAMRAA